MSAGVNIPALLEQIRLVVREEIAANAPRAEDAALSPLSLLTADELCKRWGIEAETQTLRLHRLAALCRRRGLNALNGTRGTKKRFALTDVLAAEKKAGAWRAAA